VRVPGARYGSNTAWMCTIRTAPLITTTASSAPHSSPFGWRRVRVVLLSALAIALPSLPGWTEPYALLVVRLAFVGAVQLAVFALFERWPKRLPRWVARWALQVASVGVVVPFAMALVFWLTAPSAEGPWFENKLVMASYSRLTMLGLLVSPWIAVAALLRQIRDEARHQALAFELERTQLAQQALDARLRVLQAQVEPHFLFNTLANVRELVEDGSRQAIIVLDSLITYLRAAVPRLHATSTPLAVECELARAYLEIMQMRMPDRLEYSIHVDAAVHDVPLPPMAVLTLVENAVRHGIDPCTVGGRIEVRATRSDDVCRLDVIDTGAGLRNMGEARGTGLATLRQRLELAYGSRARLEVRPATPRGTRATLELPLEARA
jgi:hypothetical protein